MLHCGSGMSLSISPPPKILCPEIEPFSLHTVIKGSKCAVMVVSHTGNTFVLSAKFLFFFLSFLIFNKLHAMFEELSTQVVTKAERGVIPF